MHASTTPRRTTTRSMDSTSNASHHPPPTHPPTLPTTQHLQPRQHHQHQQQRQPAVHPPTVSRCRCRSKREPSCVVSKCPCQFKGFSQRRTGIRQVACIAEHGQLMSRQGKKDENKVTQQRVPISQRQWHQNARDMAIHSRRYKYNKKMRFRKSKQTESGREGNSVAREHR